MSKNITVRYSVCCLGVFFAAVLCIAADIACAAATHASIKGLSCIVDINDAKKLGVNYCTENFSIGDLIDWSNPDPKMFVVVDGQKVGIKENYVHFLDRRLKTLTDGGIKVMLVLLNQLPAAADSNNPLIHPDTDRKNAPYGLGAFNVKTARGVACYRAAIEFLAARYGRPDKKFGSIAGFIVGNELQVHWEYYNLGRADMAKVIESYAPAVRYAHTAARKYSRDIDIFISMTNTWTLNNDDPEMTFAGKVFLEKLNDTLRAEGDFDWGVAFHPYPDRLSDPRFWLDKNATMDFNSPKITFRNIEILPAFLKQKSFLYNGKMRKLILSEQGFNTPPTQDGEKIQAAAYAYAYYKISRIPEIDAFILHRHIDHPQELNLSLGLWTCDPNAAVPAETTLRKKYIWDVFKEADGPNWRQAFEFALPVIGIKDWDEALPARVKDEDLQIVPDLTLGDANRIPDGFPEYRVPGYEKQLNTVRQMFYHHYLFYPGATYNDGYIMMSLAWPDTGADPRYMAFKHGMRTMLSNRTMLPDGYVTTMQHIGLAHPDGWPFPLWIQSGGMGWHFSNDDISIWQVCGIKQTTDTHGWTFKGASAGLIEPKKGLHLELTDNHTVITTPDFAVKGLVSPLITLHWWPDGVAADAVFYLEWKTKKYPDFDQQRRRYFGVAASDGQLIQTAVELYPMLSAEDTITQVRVVIDNAKGAKIALERLFTAVDSRHPCNNFVWLQGSIDYLNWTGDLDFLRSQIQRWRLAVRYAIDEFSVEKDKCVNVPWLNHDGRSGITYDKEGKWVPLAGHGMGGSYFDLIPCGGRDGWNTLFLYDVLLRMAGVEEKIQQHPQWNIPAGPMRFDPAYLRGLADGVRKNFQDIFWNSKTGRFVCGIDRDDRKYDYGFLYYNLETIYYGVASTRQSRSIYDWIDGKRIVKDDTSQGADIYHWRFAPRATTKRNMEYYVYVWNPKQFAWGDQVQDGGGVLAWSYYDLMSRIKINGPDDGWRRLQEIIAWFDEVQSHGGYRAYYATPGRGRLQGGNVAGGLGLDCEFFENIMVPQVMIYGFMGLQPGLDALTVNPQLPSDWPQLTITSIRWHGYLLDITVKNKVVDVKVRQGDGGSLNIVAPESWKVVIG